MFRYFMFRVSAAEHLMSSVNESLLWQCTKSHLQAVGSPVHAVSGCLADLIVGSRAVQPVYADPLSTGYELPVGI